MRSRSVEIEGLDGILKQLEEMGEQVSQKKQEMMKEAAEHLVEEIKKEAKGLDDGLLTGEDIKYGTLEENIKSVWDEESQTYIISDGNAYWGDFIEWGVKAYDIEKKPFMEPTFRRNKRKVKKMIEDGIKKVMDL